MAKYLQGSAPAAQFDEYNRLIWKFDYQDFCASGNKPEVELTDDIGEQLVALGGVKIEE